MSVLMALPCFQLPRPPDPETRLPAILARAECGTFPDPNRRLEQLRLSYERAHASPWRHRRPSVTLLTAHSRDGQQLDSVYAYADAQRWNVTRARFNGLRGLVDACLHVRSGFADGILASEFHLLSVSLSEYEALLHWLDIHRGFLAHTLRLEE